MQHKVGEVLRTTVPIETKVGTAPVGSDFKISNITRGPLYWGRLSCDAFEAESLPLRASQLQPHNL